jgi:zinc transporter ZupT
MDYAHLIYWTLLTGILSALATGLGAIPVHFLQNNTKIVRGFASAVAAGMMISASVFSLAQEGIALKTKFPLAPYIVILGLMLGAAFFRYSEKYMNHSDASIKKLYTKHGVSRRSFLIFLAMLVHSIPEGIAIGVSFATGNLQFGLIMAIAIAVHNIPEGIAISLPLKAEGVSTRNCAIASILTSIPQPIMAVPSAMLAWFFEPLLPVGLGFAGGAMIYITMIELIPEALEQCGTDRTAWGVMVGLCGMLLITTLLGLIQY